MFWRNKCQEIKLWCIEFFIRISCQSLTFFVYINYFAILMYINHIWHFLCQHSEFLFRFTQFFSLLPDFIFACSCVMNTSQKASCENTSCDSGCSQHNYNINDIEECCICTIPVNKSSVHFKETNRSDGQNGQDGIGIKIK